MFNKDIKKCMFHEASGETKPKLQGDTTIYTPKWLKLKRQIIPSSDRNVEQLEFSSTTPECVNLDTCLAVSTNSELLHTLYHNNFTSGYTPNRNVYTGTSKCKGKNVYNHTPHDSKNVKTAQMKKLWYIHTTQYCKVWLANFFCQDLESILCFRPHIVSVAYSSLFFTTLYKCKSQSSLVGYTRTGCGGLRVASPCSRAIAMNMLLLHIKTHMDFTNIILRERTQKSAYLSFEAELIDEDRSLDRGYLWG